jgi:hypothetical protein
LFNKQLSSEFPEKQLIQDFISKIDEFYSLLAQNIVDNTEDNADRYKPTVARLITYLKQEDSSSLSGSDFISGFKIFYNKVFCRKKFLIFFTI